MHVLTDPNALESLPLPEPTLRELRQQLAIPGYNPEGLRTLWQELPAGLIYFEEGDLPEVLLMALLAHLPPPEYEEPICETLQLRLYLLSGHCAALYLIYNFSQ